jgi:hypothetical protein
MRAFDETDLERVFYNLTLQPPRTPAAGVNMDEVRKAAKSYAVIVVECCPRSRELSQALTALEDSCIYAIAAIARNQGD